MGAIVIETYPTVVRSTALGLLGGMSTLFSLIGSSICAIFMETTDNNLILTITFAVSLFISAISCIFVIETRHFDSNTYFNLKFN